MKGSINEEKGRPLSTDVPRNKYLVMRDSEKERAAILRHFHSALDLRAYLLKIACRKAAENKDKTGD